MDNFKTEYSDTKKKQIKMDLRYKYGFRKVAVDFNSMLAVCQDKHKNVHTGYIVLNRFQNSFEFIGNN